MERLTRRQHRLCADHSGAPYFPHTPERILSDFEQRRRLQLAMGELPDEQREVLVLRLERELSLEEIAEITGVGRETVKSRLRYAMDKLRTRLAS